MTGRYWDDSATMDRRLSRALVVQAFGPEDIDALEYIRRAKRSQ